MTIISKEIVYRHSGVNLQGYMAWDDAFDEPRPAVLISHDAMGGKTAFEHGRAEAIAALGYVGFALDVYGKTSRADDAEQAYALMNPFIADRQLLRDRLFAAQQVLAEQPEVDSAQMAAMGYCFGGLCSLELARSGAAVKGVASFHGLLEAGEIATVTSAVSVLVLHGWDDPFVPSTQVDAFTQEMTAANIDWQLIAYGHAMHSFTNPGATSPAEGVAYHPLVERRSWMALQQFLAEIFA